MRFPVSATYPLAFCVLRPEKFDGLPVAMEEIDVVVGRRPALQV